MALHPSPVSWLIDDDTSMCHENLGETCSEVSTFISNVTLPFPVLWQPLLSLTKDGCMGNKAPVYSSLQLAAREMRFVGHRAGNLGLALRRLLNRSEPFPSRLLPMPCQPSLLSRLACCILSLKPRPSVLGTIVPILCLHAYYRGGAEGGHLVIGIGETLLGRVVAAWHKRDAPGNKAGDTDTSEGRQTIRYD